MAEQQREFDLAARVALKEIELRANAQFAQLA
jgi:hypothetical protein